MFESLESAQTTTLESIQAKMAAEEAKNKGAADQIVKDNYYKWALSYGLGTVGCVAGIMLAIKRKSGFWGGVGWFIVGSMAGSGVGYVIGSVIDGKPKG